MTLHFGREKSIVQSGDKGNGVTGSGFWGAGLLTFVGDHGRLGNCMPDIRLERRWPDQWKECDRIEWEECEGRGGMVSPPRTMGPNVAMFSGSRGRRGAKRVVFLPFPLLMVTCRTLPQALDPIAAMLACSLSVASISLSGTVYVLQSLKWVRDPHAQVDERISVVIDSLYLGCSSSMLPYRKAGEGKCLGIIQESSGLKNGKHAVMIATFVSTADNMAALVLSNVGSLELDMATSDWSLMIEIMHTLALVSVWSSLGFCQTYSPPTAKTTMSAFFCAAGISSLRKTGIGRRNIKISWTILTVELVNQTTCWSKHFPPRTVLSQKKLIGKQRKILPTKVHKPYNPTNTRIAPQMNRNRRVWKILR